jgi:hypothetical protein
VREASYLGPKSRRADPTKRDRGNVTGSEQLQHYRQFLSPELQKQWQKLGPGLSGKVLSSRLAHVAAKRDDQR